MFNFSWEILNMKKNLNIKIKTQHFFLLSLSVRKKQAKIRGFLFSTTTLTYKLDKLLILNNIAIINLSMIFLT
jgi:hypothetical protein